MDKLEKQVSRLPKKDLSKGQSQSLFWLKEVLEMNTSLALFLSLCLPKKLIIQLMISKFISPLVFARAFQFFLYCNILLIYCNINIAP